MEDFPFNLKISYNQRLDIQLFIRHQLNNQKFRRHWIFCKGYDNIQQNLIIKFYAGFLNQGDIYRIKTSNLSVSWKEKILQQNLVHAPVFNSFTGLSKKKHKINLKTQLNEIQNQVKQKQYDQMCIISIFLAETLKQQEYQQLKKIILENETSEFLINAFVPDELLDKLTSQKAWIRTYSTKQLKQEMRGFFGSMNKITYKKITVKLRCHDGDFVLSERLQKFQKSFWKSQGECIYHNIFFPSCNSPYIMSVEIKNMLKIQTCNFEIQFLCYDQTDHVSKSLKTFSLKPRRQFLDWMDTDKNFQNQGIKLSNYHQLSLNFQEVNLNQKLNFLRIYGTPGRVILKNKSQV